MDTTYTPLTALRGRVGCVIPIWFAPDLEATAAARLLRSTIAGSDVCLDPGDVLLVVDGSAVGENAARRLSEESGCRLRVLPDNRGKGGALAAGFEQLLAESPGLDWIAVRDADGDHLIEDLSHLYRACEQATAACPARPVLGIGRRSRVDAPLGWVRAECEWLLNEITIEAVSHALARTDRVWDTRFLVERVPDIQSGYKLYNRDAAARARHALTNAAAAHPDLPMLRIGMELAPFVRVVLDGGVIVEAERRAFFDQPVSSYTRERFAYFYGDKLAWVLRECGTSPENALLLFDGALGRRPLYTDGGGRALLLELRTRVLAQLHSAHLAAVTPVTRAFV